MSTTIKLWSYLLHRFGRRRVFGVVSLVGVGMVALAVALPLALAHHSSTGDDSTFPTTDQIDIIGTNLRGSVAGWCQIPQDPYATYIGHTVLSNQDVWTYEVPDGQGNSIQAQVFTSQGATWSQVASWSPAQADDTPNNPHLQVSCGS